MNPQVIFTMAAWQKIMKVCTPFLSTSEADIRIHPAIGMIHLDCIENQCTAVGLDGYRMSMCHVSCKLTGPKKAVKLLVLPCKPPKDFDTVTVEETEVGKLTIIYSYAVGDKKLVEPQPIYICEPTPYERVVEKAYHPEKQTLCIAFNPNYLIRALTPFAGKSDKNAVLMFFGNQVEPVVMRYMKDEPEAPTIETICYPVRIS